MKKLVTCFTIILFFIVSVSSVSASIDGSISDQEDSEIVTYNCLTGAETVSLIDLKYTNSSIGSESEEAIISEGYNPGLPIEDILIMPDSIIGKDNRVPVNPSYFPYSAVTCLYIGRDQDGNGTIESWYDGTGFMEGPDLLVTAGHCMWSGTYGWADELRVYKQQNSETFSSTHYHPLNWTCSTAYTNNLDYRYDWCLVTLQNNIGDSTGWFGKGYSSGSLVNKAIAVSGYPSDHEHFQYKASGTISFSDTYIMKFNADAVGGESGAPVYDTTNVSWGIFTYSGGTFNQGNRFTEYLYSLLQQKYLEGIEKWH